MNMLIVSLSTYSQREKLDKTKKHSLYYNHFSTSSMNPSVVFAFERRSIYQLLLSLTVSLRRGFSMTANHEGILAREPAVTSEGTKETKNVQTIILAGASNLASLKPIFEANGAGPNRAGWFPKKMLSRFAPKLSPW